MAAVRDTRDDVSWYAAFIACAVAAALPFLVTYRMPMADLPQHAIQATVWKHFFDPCYRFFETYQINWVTPYLLSTFLARLLAGLMTVNAALKVIAYVCVVSLPLVFRAMARYSGLNQWLALLAFPLAFGFSFYWGFINFILVTPIAFLVFLAVVAKRNVFLVAALTFLVAISHSLAYAVLVSIAGPYAVVDLRRKWRQLIALSAPAPLIGWWVLASYGEQQRARAPWFWQLDVNRVVQWLDHLLSPGRDAYAVWIAVLIVILIVASGVRPSADRRRWILPAMAFVMYLVVPVQAFGQSFLYQRYAVFIVGSAILALAPGRALMPLPILRVLIFALTLTWLVVLMARFHAYHQDADGFDRLVDAMPANQRVLLLNVTTRSEAVPGVPFLHFSGYYLERKGGVIGWSFAGNFTTVMRYKPDYSPGVPTLITHDPRYFVWKEHSHFDYFVVRAPGDMTPLIFPEAGGNARLLRKAGLWWLYENRGRAERPLCPPFVPDRAHDPILSLGK